MMQHRCVFLVLVLVFFSAESFRAARPLTRIKINCHFKGGFGKSNCQMSKPLSVHVLSSQKEGESGDKHMNIPTLLKEYGLIALCFHFCVWITSLSIFYAILYFGVDLNNLPFISSFISVEPNEVDAAKSLNPAILFGTAVGILELTGPFRLALTAAVTPKLSVVLRRYAYVRDAEAGILSFLSSAQSYLMRSLTSLNERK
jgi:hypothetical protein